MGVALRILMKKSGDLSRNELLAFVNTMNKWIESITLIDKMDMRLKKAVKG